MTSMMRLAGTVAIFLVAASPAFAQSYHTLDGSQCGPFSGDIASHLCSADGICPAAAGDAGYAFSPEFVFKSQSDCERVRQGAIDTCRNLKGNCGSFASCTPHAGTGASAAPTPDMVAKAVTQALLNKGRIDEATGLAAAGQIGTGLGNAIGSSLRRSIEEGNARAAQARLLAEQQRKAEAEAKERQHLETVAALRPIGDESDERMHSRMGAPFDGNAPVEDRGEIRLSTLDQSPMMLRSVDTAGGGPIAQCTEWKESSVRLRGGLGPMKEAIERTKKVLADSTMEKRVADAEFVKARKDAALAAVNQVVGHYAKLEARLRQVAGRDVSELQRRLSATKEQMDRLGKLANGLREEGIAQDPAKMKAFVERTKEATSSLEKLREWAESPLTQASADVLSSFVPIAELTLELGKAGVDMTAAYGAGRIAETDRARARENLLVQENALRNAELQAQDLDNLRKLYCPG